MRKFDKRSKQFIGDHFINSPNLFSWWCMDVVGRKLILVSLNPLSPSIHIQILQTNLHTFPLRISWENLIKHQGIFSFVIIFYILTTLSLDNVWTLLGEICCWSLLGLKGLMGQRAILPPFYSHVLSSVPWSFTKTGLSLKVARYMHLVGGEYCTAKKFFWSHFHFVSYKSNRGSSS